MDSIDVTREVGGEKRDTADWTGRETPAMHGGDMIVQPGHAHSTPGTRALEPPVFSQDVSLERRLALELFRAVATLPLRLAGGNQRWLQQPRMMNGLVFLQ